MRLRFLVWWALLPKCVFTQPTLPPPINIFILAGQSNMAGRGGVVTTASSPPEVWDGVIPPDCAPNPSLLRLDPQLTWVEAREPLHKGIDTGAAAVGVGPGVAFARALVAGSPPGFGPVGLVPCAAGGTNIGQWEKGGALYHRMIQRASAAATSGGGDLIKGLLWYQGESDTVHKQDAESYGQRLVKLFDDVRTDLMSPMLPIIQVALASGKGRYIGTVREAQFEINLLNLRTVDAKGLALESDNLHLTTESQVRLGKIMAAEFLRFLPTNAVNISLQTSNSSPALFSINFTTIVFLTSIVYTNYVLTFCSSIENCFTWI